MEFDKRIPFVIIIKNFRRLLKWQKGVIYAERVRREAIISVTPIIEIKPYGIQIYKK